MNLPQVYHDLIENIANMTGMTDAMLHVHAGLAILLVVRLIHGGSLGTFVPFMAVVVLEAANETMDYFQSGMLWRDTLTDVAYTLLWPFLISLVVRLRPDKPIVHFPEPTNALTHD